MQKLNKLLFVLCLFNIDQVAAVQICQNHCDRVTLSLTAYKYALRLDMEITITDYGATRIKDTYDEEDGSLTIDTDEGGFRLKCEDVSGWVDCVLSKQGQVLKRWNSRALAYASAYGGACTSFCSAGLNDQMSFYFDQVINQLGGVDILSSGAAGRIKLIPILKGQRKCLPGSLSTDVHNWIETAFDALQKEMVIPFFRYILGIDITKYGVEFLTNWFDSRKTGTNPNSSGSNQ